MCKALLSILEIKCCKTLALTRVLLYTGHSWKCLAGSVWAYTGAPDRTIKMEEKNDYIAVSVPLQLSLIHIFTVRDVADVYGYEPIRYFMLTAGYRMPLNYTVDLIESCKNSLERLYLSLIHI